MDLIDKSAADRLDAALTNISHDQHSLHNLASSEGISALSFAYGIYREQLVAIGFPKQFCVMPFTQTRAINLGRISTAKYMTATQVEKEASKKKAEHFFMANQIFANFNPTQLSILVALAQLHNGEDVPLQGQFFLNTAHMLEMMEQHTDAVLSKTSKAINYTIYRKMTGSEMIRIANEEPVNKFFGLSAKEATYDDINSILSEIVNSLKIKTHYLGIHGPCYQIYRDHMKKETPATKVATAISDDTVIANLTWS